MQPSVVSSVMTNWVRFFICVVQPYGTAATGPPYNGGGGPKIGPIGGGENQNQQEIRGRNDEKNSFGEGQFKGQIGPITAENLLPLISRKVADWRKIARKAAQTAAYHTRQAGQRFIQPTRLSRRTKQQGASLSGQDSSAFLTYPPCLHRLHSQMPSEKTQSRRGNRA
jgi:hypothetical protein